MKYLLDTCVISDFIKGEPNTLNRIKNTSPSDIAVSTITTMEIEYGLALNSKLANTIKPLINDFLTAVHIIPFTTQDGNEAAIARALLKQQGNPIGSYDILLAGTALNHKLIIVTSNLKEFTRVPGLKFENWRTA
jgi:tRNA(fMet)-specific endonuclease VapC